MNDNNYKNIPNCLRKYRKARGLKQKEAAEILGLKSTSMISRWEKGVCLPSSLSILKLALLYRTLANALYIDLMRLLKEEILKKEKKVLKTKNA